MIVSPFQGSLSWGLLEGIGAFTVPRAALRSAFWADLCGALRAESADRCEALRCGGVTVTGIYPA